MPEKEDRPKRMVVEEIEIPAKEEKAEETKTETEKKPDILETGEKVSSQDVIEQKVSMPEPQSESKKSASPVFWILIPGIFILGAILGGIVFYQRGVNSIQPNQTPTPAPTYSATPTPNASPSATPSIGRVQISVLNGSGIAGEAGKVKDLLTAAGFNVVSTGNAATYDYVSTVIKAKSTVDASVIQKIKDALNGTYQIGANQTLSSSSTVDIQVIVGSSKAE